MRCKTPLMISAHSGRRGCERSQCLTKAAGPPCCAAGLPHPSLGLGPSERWWGRRTILALLLTMTLFAHDLPRDQRGAVGVTTSGLIDTTKASIAETTEAVAAWVLAQVE